MQWRSELFVRPGARIVGSRTRIVRHAAVRAPHPLEFSAIRIEDNHAPVSIAIGNVQFASLLIDLDTCGAPQQ